MSKFSKVSSAEVMAFVRTIGVKERDERLKSNDYIAPKFLAGFVAVLLSFRLVRKVILAAFSKKLPGGMPYIIAKSRVIDDMLLTSLETGGVEQLIFLGAGYDTRAYRFSDALSGTMVYEIDHPEMISRKIAKIQELGLTQDNVKYCAIDFEGGTQTFSNVWLNDQGVDLAKRTLIIADGVSYFINSDAFDNVLEVAHGFASGSEIIFDYVYQEIFTGQRFRGSEEFKAALLEQGEPVINGIEQGQIKTYLKAFGLEVASLLTPSDIERNYLSNGVDSIEPYGFLNIVKAGN